MNIVIGLGNPEKRYEQTRHNVGFLVLDTLQKQWGFPPFQENGKFFALISEGMKNNQKIMLAKPLTFMNRSGQAVRAMIDFYKLSQTNILIIHDDLDLPFGTLRLASNSGSAGHNGVQNIIDILGTQEFRRLRIGIGRPTGDTDPTEHVLSRFTDNELKNLATSFPTVETLIETLLAK